MNEYKADLLEDLKDIAYAGKYLTAAYADSMESWLLALRDVAEVHKGIAKLATDAGVNRENLYRMLSRKGNPRTRNLGAVLRSLPFEVVFVAKSGAHQDEATAPNPFEIATIREPTSRTFVRSQFVGQAGVNSIGGMPAHQAQNELARISPDPTGAFPRKPPMPAMGQQLANPKVPTHAG